MTAAETPAPVPLGIVPQSNVGPPDAQKIAANRSFQVKLGIVTNQSAITVETLYADHRAFLLSAAARIVGAEDAADCVQGAFVRMLRFWGQRDPAKTLSWAKAVVINEALDRIRKRKREAHDVSLEALPEQGVYYPALFTRSHAHPVEARIDVDFAVSQLKQPGQEAIRSWILNEGGHRCTARSIQFRAIRKMRLVLTRTAPSSFNSSL